jgi:SH3-like domain-containing protein
VWAVALEFDILTVMKTFLVAILFFMQLSSHAACIAQNKVKMHAKPDSKAKVSWVVGENMPVLEVNKKGAWYQVQDFEGEKHWVHARHLTWKGSCVVVKSLAAKLRLGPGQKFAATDLGSVKRYAVFKKVGRDDDWLKLQDSYGQIHWAHENNFWEPREYSRVNF